VAAPSIEAGSTYQVRNNDTLWRIASAAHPGNRGDVNRAMLAIYQANPQAFDGNINLLKAGSSLRIPEASELTALSASAAAEEVARQYREWQGAAGQASGDDAGRLRLVTPDQGSASASTAAPSAAGGNAAELQSRVAELEAELAEARRLLEVRNAELATLQGQTAPGATTPVPVEGAPTTPPEATGEPVPGTEPVVEPEASAEPPPVAAPAAEPEATPKPARPQATPEPESRGILGTLADYWWALLGLLLVLGLGGYLLRKRRESAGGESLEEAFGRREPIDLRSKPMVARPREPEILVEEKRPMDVGVARTANLATGTATATGSMATATATGSLGSATGSFGSGAAAARAPEPSRKPVSIDDTMSGEIPPNLEAGDPLAEADFHMAYGLYDQAADLVQLAIRREPQRADLKLKLLEIYFVWGNRDRFLEVAREMSTRRGELAAGDWDKAVIMGKQLAPDDALFASAVAGAGSLDLDLQDSATGIDLDFTSPASSGPDIDLTGSAPEVSDEGMGLDFVLDEPQRGAADGDSQSPTVESLAPTVESLAPTIESLAPTIEATALKKRDTSESTQEVDLESLGLDIDLPSGLDESDLPDELAATINKRAEDTIEQPIKRSPPKARPEEDLVNMTNIMRGGTGQMPAFQLPDDDVSIVLDSSESTGELPVIETTRIQPAPDLGAVDFSLGEEAATMSEVGTKLDLARAYIDMGDPEGARSILEEVLQEGNATQKQEANRLIASLP
jgi:pilus assembly protein FimV